MKVFTIQHIAIELFFRYTEKDCMFMKSFAFIAKSILSEVRIYGL